MNQVAQTADISIRLLIRRWRKGLNQLAESFPGGLQALPKEIRDEVIFMQDDMRELEI